MKLSVRRIFLPIQGIKHVCFLCVKIDRISSRLLKQRFVFHMLSMLPCSSDMDCILNRGSHYDAFTVLLLSPEFGVMAVAVLFFGSQKWPYLDANTIRHLQILIGLSLQVTFATIKTNCSTGGTLIKYMKQFQCYWCSWTIFFLYHCNTAEISLCATAAEITSILLHKDVVKQQQQQQTNW